MGTYFSPRVPEVCLTSPGRVSGASLTSGGSLAPMSLPLGVSGGTMYSRWGPWEHVSPLPRLSGEPVFLPGFLGVLEACQSWAISLPREEGDLGSMSGKGSSWPSLHLSSGGL